MQFKIIVEVPDEIFEKLKKSQLEIGEETIAGINEFDRLEFQKEFIRDSLENLTGWAVSVIEVLK